MRFICFLLAMLVLTLSVQPVCATVNESTCCNEAVSCSSDTEDLQHHNEDNCKGCNPFQACGCCAFAVMIPTSITLQSPTLLVHSGVYSGFASEGLPVAACADFWQPPRAC